MLRDRLGVPTVGACSACSLPAAALVPGPPRTGEAVVWASCVQAMNDALDDRVTEIDPADLDAAAELTPEQEFEHAMADEEEFAMADEEEFAMLPDGTLVAADQDPRRDDLAWSLGARGRAARW